jgi:hypothetical protein
MCAQSKHTSTLSKAILVHMYFNVAISLPQNAIVQRLQANTVQEGHVQTVEVLLSRDTLNDKVSCHPRIVIFSNEFFKLCRLWRRGGRRVDTNDLYGVCIKRPSLKGWLLRDC